MRGTNRQGVKSPPPGGLGKVGLQEVLEGGT
jgi:hypothetical protein